MLGHSLRPTCLDHWCLLKLRFEYEISIINLFCWADNSSKACNIQQPLALLANFNRHSEWIQNCREEGTQRHRQKEKA